MEGLLVILVSAISLSFFLQQQQKGDKKKPSPFFHWDTWAKQEGFTFTPPTPEMPMNIVAELSPYFVYIYARVIQSSFVDRPIADMETEIKVPLLYTIASGFWLQSKEHLERNRITKTVRALQFSDPTMDAFFHVEAKDEITGSWVLQHQEYLDIFKNFQKKHPRSHIEQKAVSIRVESADIALVAQGMAEALTLATQLDEVTIKIWQTVANQMGWDLQRQYGFPILWSRNEQIRFQVHIPDSQNPTIEFLANFPLGFPNDLSLWGMEFRKEGQNLESILDNHIWFDKGFHPKSANLFDDQEIQIALQKYFTLCPSSFLNKACLKIRFPGKCNPVLEQHLKAFVDLCHKMHQHYTGDA